MNWNNGVLSLVGPSGPKPIDSDGGVVSIVIDRNASAVLPASSVTFTRKVELPSGNGVARVYGLVQVASVSWSIAHAALDPASAVNENDGVVSFVGSAGSGPIASEGAALSTVKSRLSPAWLPALSVASTRKVYLPSATSGLAGVYGLAHSTQAGVPLSIEHAIVLSPVTVNPNDGARLFVISDHEVTLAVGLTVSTVKTRSSFETFPSASLARTLKVCLPSESDDPTLYGLSHPATGDS